MKIAIISDVHGNYPALKNVIDDAVKNAVDQFIFLGDYIFDMPFSNEVVRTIMSLENAHIISGNKERNLHELINENQDEWTSVQMGALYQTYRELHKDVLNYLLDLPNECYIPLDSGKVIYATHYPEGMSQMNKVNSSSSKFREEMLAAPFTHQEYLTRLDELLKQDDFYDIFARVNADVILYGHAHLQGYGYCGERLIINPGSCGQPLDFDSNAPYTILEEDSNGFRVIEKRVPYEIEQTINLARASSVYINGTIWCELCFLAMRTGRDYFGIFFEIAYKLALSKNEKGRYFSNSTWEETYAIFRRKYML